LLIYFKNDSGPSPRLLKIHSCGDPLPSTCACDAIECVTQYKYLEIMIDHRLNWEPHVQYVKQKLRKIIYAFGQLRQVLTVEHCRSVYYAYMLSVMQYGILASDGASTSMMEPLAVTQRSNIKTILNRNIRYPSNSLFFFIS
jgi:hypothetical protein